MDVQAPLESLASRAFEAFLFDMDGTVLTSIKAAERVWSRWAVGHGLDPAPIIARMHGVRAEDTVRHFAPRLDAAEEARQIMDWELQEIDGVHEIPGAAAFVRGLAPDRWAIVTSAPRQLAKRRLSIAGLPHPDVLIAAEDVERGKPHPEPYLKAAARLGRDIGRCLVWEDAPAGIAAGRAAGATVVAMAAREPLAPDDLVALNDFQAIRATVTSDGALRLAAI